MTDKAEVAERLEAMAVWHARRAGTCRFFGLHRQADRYKGYSDTLLDAAEALRQAAALIRKMGE